MKGTWMLLLKNVEISLKSLKTSKIFADFLFSGTPFSKLDKTHLGVWQLIVKFVRTKEIINKQIHK